MSSIKVNSNAKVNAKVNANKSTHYCKVCHDSGKPESEYRSHSTRETRDPNSRVTCPILLAIECRFCHKAGHTVKYCPALKDKKREEARASKKLVLNSKPDVVEKVANMYCLLEVEIEEEEREVFEDEFPSINTNIPIHIPASTQLNYAAALATSVVTEDEAMPMPMPMTRTASLMPMVKKSWVQMSMDSDSEDEEDGSAW